MANNALQITDLDFLSIKTNLKNFLRSQSEFTDYDFEGSGMSVLLDVLAYNTYYKSYYASMVGTEMFEDSAQLRSSMVSHAKLMNYVPTSRRSASAKINVVITPGIGEDQTTQSVTMQRGTQFISNPVDGVSYNFVTTNSYTAQKTNSSFTFANTVISQGEYVAKSFSVDSTNPSRRYLIPSANVDTSTIQVTVQTSSMNSYTTVYNPGLDITEITSNSSVFFVEENPDSNGSYTLYFGDGIIGNRPIDGNIINLTYVDTQGPVANKANTFTSFGLISGFSTNVVVTSTQTAAGGSLKEDIETIRFRAPIAYTAQNRMVTKNDYRSLLAKDYPNIQSIAIWGGEEYVPPVYGKVFISLNPVLNYSFSVIEKTNIVNNLIKNRSIMTVIPELVDPDYTYLLLNMEVEYDSRRTSLVANDISSLMRAVVVDFQSSYLNKFNTTFRGSRLETNLNEVDSSVLGVDLNVYAQKRTLLSPGQTMNYTIDFGFPLTRGTQAKGLYSYPSITVPDSSGTYQQVFFEEIPQSYTGIGSVVITNTGGDYQTTPKVTIIGDGVGATAEAIVVNGQVTAVNITNKGSGYTSATAQFDSGAAAGTVILDSDNGDLRTYYYTSSGFKVIVNANAGTIDYVRGRIVLEALNVVGVTDNDRYDANVLTLNIKPNSNIISPSRNQILLIDLNDSAATNITISDTQDV